MPRVHFPPEQEQHGVASQGTSWGPCFLQGRHSGAEMGGWRSVTASELDLEVVLATAAPTRAQSKLHALRARQPRKHGAFAAGQAGAFGKLRGTNWARGHSSTTGGQSPPPAVPRPPAVTPTARQEEQSGRRS